MGYAPAAKAHAEKLISQSTFEHRGLDGGIQCAATTAPIGPLAVASRTVRQIAWRSLSVRSMYFPYFSPGRTKPYLVIILRVSLEVMYWANCFASGLPAPSFVMTYPCSNG